MIRLTIHSSLYVVMGWGSEQLILILFYVSTGAMLGYENILLYKKSKPKIKFKTFPVWFLEIMIIL